MQYTFTLALVLLCATLTLTSAQSNSSDACRSLSACSSCTRMPSCGWCSSSSLCSSGSMSGPNTTAPSGSCPTVNWHWSGCPGGPAVRPAGASGDITEELVAAFFGMVFLAMSAVMLPVLLLFPACVPRPGTAMISAQTAPWQLNCSGHGPLAMLLLLFTATAKLGALITDRWVVSSKTAGSRNAFYGLLGGSGQQSFAAYCAGTGGGAGWLEPKWTWCGMLDWGSGLTIACACAALVVMLAAIVMTAVSLRKPTLTPVLLSSLWRASMLMVVFSAFGLLFWPLGGFFVIKHNDSTAQLTGSYYVWMMSLFLDILIVAACRQGIRASPAAFAAQPAVQYAQVVINVEQQQQLVQQPQPVMAQAQPNPAYFPRQFAYATPHPSAPVQSTGYAQMQ